jgi:hypothetical protein
MADQPVPRWVTNPPPGLQQYLAAQDLQVAQSELLTQSIAGCEEQPKSPSSIESAVVQLSAGVQPAATFVLPASHMPSIKAKGPSTSFTLPRWLTTSGPWDSVDHAVSDINRQWALCDDGVGVLHKGSQQNYLTKEKIQIQRKDLYCYQKTKTNCKFRITIESRGRDASWDVVGVGHECNHPNPKTASQQNAFASHRGIPDDLRLVGVGMRKSGGTTTFIHRHLASMYRDQYGMDAPFNYQDVYHSINPHGYQQALDTTGFIQHLQQNKDEEGLDFSYKHDADGILSLCFNVFKDAVKLYSDGCRPVLFDTKHGTNRYGLRLGCFTTVGRDGGTVLLATAMITHEDQLSFEWAFDQFKKFFISQPHCMFTDGDKAMAAAMRTTLPQTKHYLCIWHLSQTLIKNTKGNIQFFSVLGVVQPLVQHCIFFKTVVVHVSHILISPKDGSLEQALENHSCNSMERGGNCARTQMCIFGKHFNHNGKNYCF